jgi:hypothetical protein
MKVYTIPDFRMWKVVLSYREKEEKEKALKDSTESESSTQQNKIEKEKQNARS